MKKDIEFPEVEGVQLAIICEEGHENEPANWTVFLINKNNFTLENTMVSSQGYGFRNDEKLKTSTLRHFLKDVASGEVKQIEIIDTSVFDLSNEYWLSFYANGKLYDKKYIFAPGSICEQNLSLISPINKMGILHL